jgi:hypothetical protein
MIEKPNIKYFQYKEEGLMIECKVDHLRIEKGIEISTIELYSSDDHTSAFKKMVKEIKKHHVSR